MSDSNTSSSFAVCKICAHHIPLTKENADNLACDRCGFKNRTTHPKSVALTLSFSLTALILYLPANIFPFMSIELYGNRNTSTIWSGIVTLTESGSWPIAVIVFLASILIPFVKLVILFYLSATAKNKKHPQLKTRLYHFIEAIGRWSMLDIFLLAVLVAILKLGPWTTVEPKLGALMFAMVVIFTMLASASFDPQLIWKDENEKSN